VREAFSVAGLAAGRMEWCCVIVTSVHAARALPLYNLLADGGNFQPAQTGGDTLLIMRTGPAPGYVEVSSTCMAARSRWTRPRPGVLADR
jgi:hypothetical protein